MIGGSGEKKRYWNGSDEEVKQLTKRVKITKGKMERTARMRKVEAALEIQEPGAGLQRYSTYSCQSRDGLATKCRLPKSDILMK